MKKLIAGVLVALTCSAIAASPASATHSWGGYHWAQANTSASAPSVRVDLGDNLVSTPSTDWPAIFKGSPLTGASVSLNWSNLHLIPTPNLFADVLETPPVTGANVTSQKRCKPKSGRVEVCNARYGFNGWLGLAQVWVSGGHIVQGTAKVNDSYLNSSSYATAAKQHVLCQELGHTFGLDHTSEDGSDQNTCMDYAKALDNPHTNAHDNEQINLIYRAHNDSPSTATSTSTKGNGKVRRLRKDLYVESFSNGDKLFTFVTFIDDAAARGAPTDRVPE